MIILSFSVLFCVVFCQMTSSAAAEGDAFYTSANADLLAQIVCKVTEAKHTIDVAMYK